MSHQSEAPPPASVFDGFVCFLQLFPRRCTWLYIINNNLMSLSGEDVPERAQKAVLAEQQVSVRTPALCSGQKRYLWSENFI